MRKENMIYAALLAGTAYATYKLINWFVEQSKEAELKREEFKKERDILLDEKDYRALIREATVHNKNLNAHERNVAFDLLNDIWVEALGDEKIKDLQDDLEDLNYHLDILLGDDKEAIMATIERQLSYEEDCKLNATRQHELAMAKAIGEKDINIAKIAADAEKNKASLYSGAIKTGMELLKEVNNERSEKSED